MDDSAGASCSQCGQVVSDPFETTSARTESAVEDKEGLVGKTVEGRYRVIGRVGAGGMGVVYRVEHVRMKKVAALKVLRRDLANDGAAVKRFEREAEAVSRLDHPHIVQTFDFGVWEGRPFLVMEYVRGEDLATTVRREGPLPPLRALPLFAQVLQALEEAHAHGIVHRDLKPDNIVVVRRRQGEHAKVLDFGLAKLREERGFAQPDVSSSGSLVGTPYYMSPEQVRGEAVDARSDVYSLGATLYRVLTGTPPFQAETPMGVLTRHVTDDVQPPSARRPDADLPLEIDHLVLKAMAKRPADRFASATEMREEIERVVERLETATSGTTLPAWVDRPMTSGDGPVVEPREEIPTAPARPSELSDFSSDAQDERLRREDIDAFERSLRRRRVTSVATIPLILALAGGGLYAGRRFFKKEPGQTEVEPNDTPAQAGALPRTPPLYGQIGEPKGGEPDIDVFKIPSATRTRALSAYVSGLPEVNLVLELYDAEGALVTRVDGGGDGEGEQLGPMAIPTGELYLRVRPLWVEGLPIPGGTPAAYALDVDVGPPVAGVELEPNDEPNKANRLAVPGELRGYLSSVSDKDCVEIAGQPGAEVEVRVDPVPDADVELALEGQPPVRRKTGAKEPDVLTTKLGPDGRVVVTITERPRKGGPPADRHKPWVAHVVAK